VMAGIRRQPGVTYPVLAPNLAGFDAALAAGAKEVCAFASASESFSKKNINCTIEESLARFEPIIEKASKNNVRVRGAVSCAIACPYEGPIAASAAAKVARALHELGCFEVLLADTIGVGTPGSTHALLKEVLKYVPVNKLAVHFHDTYGQALANIHVALLYGINVIDSAVGGVGGCPYAKGATGNVATEDLVYMLHGLGIETGINLDKLIEVGGFISRALNRESLSRVSRAYWAKQNTKASSSPISTSSR